MALSFNRPPSAFGRPKGRVVVITSARGITTAADFKTLTILGKCWNCKAKAKNETARVGLDYFEGDFHCACGMTVTLRAPLGGFRPSSI